VYVTLIIVPQIQIGFKLKKKKKKWFNCTYTSNRFNTEPRAKIRPWRDKIGSIVHVVLVLMSLCAVDLQR
jgi:hypothetical protein